MEVEFEHDPTLGHRPKPDRNILARAHNVMLRQQTDREKWVRQQWEATIGATRVALDAWRSIWPIEAAEMFPSHEFERVSETERLLSAAYHQLDLLSEPILGQAMYLASIGELPEEMLRRVEEEVGVDRQG